MSTNIQKISRYLSGGLSKVSQALPAVQPGWAKPSQQVVDASRAALAKRQQRLAQPVQPAKRQFGDNPSAQEGEPSGPTPAGVRPAADAPAKRQFGDNPSAQEGEPS